MSKQTPKNHKNSHNTPVVLCWHEKKNWKQSEAMDIVSSSKVGRSLPKPIMLVVRSISPNLPQTGQFFYHGMLMLLDDSMPSFMNFRRVWDLLKFKNQASHCFASNQRCHGVWNSFPFLAWDLSMHPRTPIWVSTNLYALEHVHVVQIWVMHINALKTQLMHKMFKRILKNHKNSHNTPVVLCWHEKQIWKH